MKRLLLAPLLIAGLLSPIAAKAEDAFEELVVPNPYSYDRSSLVRWKNDGTRFIGFKGTTKYQVCFNNQSEYFCGEKWVNRLIKVGKVGLNSNNELIWDYKINCNRLVFDREGDWQNYINVRVDPTAELVANKYCVLNNWEKLSIDNTRKEESQNSVMDMD